ncbi:uncharacterized protein LOC120451756 [Drosophila santomea]|uniref:uncharacterized protein LOC120451756 n=1 Tax=Drosophila santomea TaxID=129105 RepID=UPI0019549040|nr:uncharacterized protein LOC120451756 [Drosophila santomea]XP_039491617.1 uncharacterized protein LOC120451756 [Drosophila santomea]
MAKPRYFGWKSFIVLMVCLPGCIALSRIDEVRNLSVTGKPALIRTELRFGRNLDPSKVRVVNVKSSMGEDVKILVGKNSRKARAEDAAESIFVRSADVKRRLVLPTSKAIASGRQLTFEHSPALLKQSELAQQMGAYRQRKAEAEQRQAKLIQMQLAKAQSRGIEHQAAQGDFRRGRHLAADVSWEPVRPQFPTQTQKISRKNISLAADRQWQPFGLEDSGEIQPRLQRLSHGPMFSFPRDTELAASDVQEYLEGDRDTRAYGSVSNQGYRPKNLITKHNYNSLPQKSKYVTYLPHSMVVTASAGVATPTTRWQTGVYASPHHNPIGQSSQSVVDGPVVTLIEGVRVPDSAEDKVKTWRNARVLNNQLVPYPKGYTPPRAQMTSFDR